jgi:ankyrin repeat protein
MPKSRRRHRSTRRRRGTRRIQRNRFSGGSAVLEEVKAALADPDRDLNAKDSEGNMLLHRAAAAFDAEAVDLLFKDERVNLNEQNTVGDTPLNLFILKAGKNTNEAAMQTLELFIANDRVDPNIPNYDTEPKTPLHRCVVLDALDILKKLLRHPNIDVNKSVPVATNSVVTPLLYACSKKRNSIIDTLLQDPRTDVNKSSHLTPLTVSVFLENVFAVEKLAKMPDIDPNLLARPSTGVQKSALFAACIKSNLEIVKILLSIPGIDVNSKDNALSTPLMASASIGGVSSGNIIHELLKFPEIDVNAVDDNNRSALWLTASIGNSANCKLLLNDPRLVIDKKTLDGALNGTLNKLSAEIITDILNKAGIKSKIRLWNGFSQSDASKFDTIFDTTVPPGGGRPPAENWSVCPVCLRYVERSDGCMYVKHKCKESKGYYHEKLFDRYNNDGYIEWCTICGRITDGHHRHYALASFSDNSKKLVEKPATNAAQHFADDCQPVGGGGLEEKFLRFLKIREQAMHLNNLIGKITEKEAFDSLVEEAWNVPATTSVLTKRVTKAFMQSKRWNIPSTYFPTNVALHRNNSPAANNAVQSNVVRPSANVEMLRPILHEMGTNSIGMLDDVPVIQFRHRQADGTVNNHEEEFIGVESLTEWLKDQVKNFGTEDFGYCWNRSGGCAARLYPDEIKDFVPAELYEDYRRKFNKKFKTA